MKTIPFLLFICLFQFLSIVAQAQAGSLDLSFSQDGKVVTPIGQYADEASAIAIQNDGKILVAGGSENNSFKMDITIVRYNTNGSLDSTFNNDGIVTTEVVGSNTVAKGIAVQTDGKIVIAGFGYFGNSFDAIFVRYLSNGNLDSTFGNNGISIIDGSLNSDYINGMALQQDGKIVATGFYGNANVTGFLVMRVLTNGKIDSSFNQTGVQLTHFGNGLDGANGVVIQPDQKILACGSSLVNNQYHLAFARYLPNGMLDSTFDGDGKMTHNLSYSSTSYAIDLQADGKFLSFGEIINPNYGVLVTRYHSDGSIDSTFNQIGIQILSYPNKNASARAGKIQSDGKIISGGYLIDNGSPDYLLTRLNTDGSIDSSFDMDGVVTTDFGNSDYCQSMAIQQDGKIVVAGHSVVGNSRDFSLARYHPNHQVGILNNSIESNFEVVPNPFSTYTEIRLAYPVNNGLISVYNMLGQEVKRIHNIQGQTIKFFRENLQEGIYYILIKEEEQKWVAQPIVIKD